MAIPPSYPPYQQPLLDRQTGRVTKPWHLFFLSLVAGASGIDAGTIVLPPDAGSGDIIYNDNGTIATKPLEQFGYWIVITNGDPVSPEILVDAAGDAVMGFVPTP